MDRIERPRRSRGGAVLVPAEAAAPPGHPAGKQAIEQQAVTSGSAALVQTFSVGAAEWHQPPRKGAYMRFATMLVLAGVLVVPGMAMAQTETNPDPMTQPPGSTDPMTQPTDPMDQPGSLEEGSDVRTSMPMDQQQQVEVFKNKDNFEVRGTVASVDAAQNKITVQREQEGLPPVELQVAQGTEIKMDGKESSLQELQAGSEVRAKFNLAQDQPIAIQLEAKPSKQQKEMNKNMERMQRE